MTDELKNQIVDRFIELKIDPEGFSKAEKFLEVRDGLLAGEVMLVVDFPGGRTVKTHGSGAPFQPLLQSALAAGEEMRKKLL